MRGDPQAPTRQAGLCTPLVLLLAQPCTLRADYIKPVTGASPETKDGNLHPAAALALSQGLGKAASSRAGAEGHT